MGGTKPSRRGPRFARRLLRLRTNVTTPNHLPTPQAKRMKLPGRNWLLVLLFLFVLPLAGGSYWMYLQSRTEIEGSELQDDVVGARTLSALVDTEFSSAERILASIASRPGFREAWARRDQAPLEDSLGAICRLEPAFLFASVYETDGTLRAIVPSDKIVGWNFAYRDWYRGVTAQWQPYVSEVYRTTVGANPMVVAVAVPIRDERDKPVGILMATYSLSDLTTKFRALEAGAAADFYVVDQHGIVAASTRTDSLNEPAGIFAPSVAARAQAGEEGSGRTRIGGENVYAGFAPIPRLHWAALYARPESVALAPAWHLRRQNGMAAIYLLLIYLATAAFAAFLARRQIRLLAANEALNRDLEAKIAEAKRAREEADTYFTLSIDLLCVAGSDGRFQRVNPAWEDALGWTTDELVAKPYMDFVHPDDRAASVREAEARRQGKPTMALENRYRRKDGSYRWLMWNATPLVNGRTYAMARDVTDARETREALLRAKDDAERSTKFKDQFLSTMSHELRTPLNAVLGFSDLLADERYGPLNDRQRRYINHIHNGGKHLLRLINDILDLSKIEAGRLQLAIEMVHLETCVGEAVDSLRPLVDKKSQDLLQQIPARLNVRADGTRLRQILTNLIGNASKFTPEGGKIEVSARKVGDTARIEVRDSGPGIPPEEQQRIFEAFHRLKQSERAVEGTGLGLAITKSLIELHGGQLGVESKLGAGSCFYFTLPLVPAMESTELEAPAPQQPGERRKILVVEDDADAAHLLEVQLSTAGYDTAFCDDPSAAVELAASLQPTAITLDIIMKPLNGWEVLARLKSDPRTAGIPVIVVTIVDQPSTGALLGADEYIVKPVDKDSFLAAVSRCLKRAGTRADGGILVVEDDAATREFVAELLSKNGYSVSTAAHATQARALVAACLPELVILDLILPGVSGFKLLADWRSDPRTAHLPVFILTSKDLNANEKEYLRANSTVLFEKHGSWQEALLRELERSTLSGVAR
jgi:PAS domain S-box-containing protein